VTAVVEDLPNTANLRVEAFAAASSSGSPLRADPGGRFDPSDQIAYTFLRLIPGVAAPAAESRLNLALRDLLASPELLGSKVRLELISVRDMHLPARRVDNSGSMAAPGDWLVIRAVLIVAALVLITACVNFVGLSTARAAQRAMEVGVRKALGATKGQIVTQFLMESFVQAAVSIILALAIAELALPAFNSLAGRPVAVDFRSPWLWAGLLGLAVAVGVGGGLYPAWVLARLRPAAALKGESPRGPRGSGIREALVTVQFAVLIVLIVAVAVCYRQGELALRKAEQVGGQHILWVSEPGVCDGGFKDALAKDPKVLDLTCASPIALQNGGAATAAATVRGGEVTLEMGMVDDHFLNFYRARVLAGRLFEGRFGSDVVLARPATAVEAAVGPSVVLNATAARQLGYSSSSAAVGRTLVWTRLNWPKGQAPAVRRGERSQIIGVIDDLKLGLNREAIRPMVYWVDPAFFSRLSLRVRSTDIMAFGQEVDDRWRETGHARPPRREWVDQAVKRVYSDVTALEAMASICAGLALLIACVGIFTLAVFTAERRRKEIGVRKAFGAARSDILSWLLWQFARPVLLSMLLSWPVAWWGLGAWLSHFPDRTPLGPDLFLAASTAALAIAGLAAGACALKASNQQPALAIRYE
jgi:putative ABC transport system permease protein